MPISQLPIPSIYSKQNIDDFMQKRHKEENDVNKVPKKTFAL